MSKPKIIMIPCLLEEKSTLNSLSSDVRKWIFYINHYIVENEKIARRFIKKIAPEKVQSKLWITELNKRTLPEDLPSFLSPCEQGHYIGVISDAGCPGIADPGSVVVKMAHQKGLEVIPLVGPSSILLSLMASGFNGQNFTFHGYLPIEKKDRVYEIKRLENQVLKTSQTQIFIETPYRNHQLLDTLVAILHLDTLLCIAVDITSSTEYISTKTIQAWSRLNLDINKRPAIFLLGI